MGISHRGWAFCNRVQNLNRYRYDSAESYPPRPSHICFGRVISTSIIASTGPIPELDILLACEQTQWSRNGGEDERIKTHENEKYKLRRVRTLHLRVTGEVEEARLLVRIPQVPTGDGTERHEEEAESSDSGTTVVDEERQ